MNAKVLSAINERSRGRCEARVQCGGARAVLTHHRKRAGRIDSIANCLRTCLACHTHLHANVAESYESGLLVHSWDDPATISVRVAVAM